MTEAEHIERASALGHYVRFIERLKMFQRGAIPTAAEAARDLADLEHLLVQSGLEMRDPELDVVYLRTQIARALRGVALH